MKINTKIRLLTAVYLGIIFGGIGIGVSNPDHSDFIFVMVIVSTIVIFVLGRGIINSWKE